MLFQVFEGEVGAKLHVAEEANVTAIEHFVECPNNALDARVIRCHSVTNQTVRGWKQVEQIYGDLEVALGLQN